MIRPAWFLLGLLPLLLLWPWPLPLPVPLAELAHELGIGAKPGDSQDRGLVLDVVPFCCRCRCSMGTLISSLWEWEASSARSRWKHVSGSSGV